MGINGIHTRTIIYIHVGVVYMCMFINESCFPQCSY